MQNKVIEKISELAESVLQGTDFFLVDVDIKGSREPVVWVYIDAEDRGVNMDECADFSNELSFLMDAHEMFGGSYRLNVSSPGVTRPLSDPRQYPKNKGRKARVKYKIGDEYLNEEGILKEIDGRRIVLEKDKGEQLVIDFDQLVETKIIPAI